MERTKLLKSVLVRPSTAHMCLKSSLALLYRPVGQLYVENIAQEVTRISLVPHMPMFRALLGLGMAQMLLFMALAPWLWAVVQPGMKNVAQKVTRISLIPHMPVFRALQGQKMVQMLLFLAHLFFTFEFWRQNLLPPFLLSPSNFRV